MLVSRTVALAVIVESPKDVMNERRWWGRCSHRDNAVIGLWFASVPSGQIVRGEVGLGAGEMFAEKLGRSGVAFGIEVTRPVWNRSDQSGKGNFSSREFVSQRFEQFGRGFGQHVRHE